MDIHTFAKTYAELEEKSKEILKIYGLGNWDLTSIGIDSYNDKVDFVIVAEMYYSGCGTEHESLSFPIEDMSNPIEWFAEKRKEELAEEERKHKELESEQEKRREQEQLKRDREEYERLRKKFEGKDEKTT